VIRDFLSENPEVSALVLGAATGGNPGPLVAHFAANAGNLPCPLYLIPSDFDEALPQE